MRKAILNLIFIGISISRMAFAQLDNKAFCSPAADSLENKQFAVHFEHLNYLRNNEYFTKIADGYTLFGLHAIPELHYQVSPEFRLEAGAFVRIDYGNKGVKEIQPTFTARYSKGNHQILMGTLDGGLQHQLIEPLYDFENQLTRRIENGFQYKFNGKKASLDAWVDWRNMIYSNSPVQEEILAGIRFEPVLLETRLLRITLSEQGTVYHKGGQIDISNLPLTTWFHNSLGTKIDINPGSGSFLKKIQVQAFGVNFLDNSNQKKFKYSKSLSSYFNLSAETKWGTVMLSYWQTSAFPSYQGGKLYRTISSNIKNPGYQEETRKLLFIRIMKDWKIGPDLWITARVEPYFDLRNNLWEFSHGLYINYRGQIWKSKTTNP